MRAAPHTRRRPRKRKFISEEEAAIGKRLQAARLRRGLTQATLAATVGIKQPVLSECETGEVRLHGALLASLARALKVSADQILGLKPLDISTPTSGRLVRRLQRLEELPTADRRSILSILDAMLQKHDHNGRR